MVGTFQTLRFRSLSSIKGLSKRVSFVMEICWHWFGNQNSISSCQNHLQLHKKIAALLTWKSFEMCVEIPLRCNRINASMGDLNSNAEHSKGCFININFIVFLTQILRSAATASWLKFKCDGKTVDWDILVNILHRFWVSALKDCFGGCTHGT